MRYNTPMVIAHKINPLTAFFVRHTINVKYVSIGNLLANEEIIPELLQEKCNPLLIAEKLKEVSNNKTSYSKFLKLLQNDKGLLPQELAYQVIVERCNSK